MVRSLRSPFLNSGLTFEDFQSVGKIPVFIDLLKIAQNDSAIRSGQTRSSSADILSRPVALDLHSFDKREKHCGCIGLLKLKTVLVILNC